MRFPPTLLSQHIAIVGKTGSGKTYTAKGFVETLLADKRRVCVIDPTGVWWGLKSAASGKVDGFAIAVFGGAHADVPITETSGPALAKILAAQNLPAIVDLSEMLIGQRHRFVTDFAEALYRENRAPLHLVIDEADEFAPQNPLPETKRMLHQVDRIVRRGRVRGFRVMLITQRPAVLHKNVLTQANALIAMRLTAPQDRKAMQAWVEGQADADQAKTVLGSLAGLKRGEGWVWAPELELLSRTTFPKITTFDSGRTPDDDEVIAEPSKLAKVDLAEIRASFDAVEQEARTLKELTAEVADLRRKLAAAEKRAGPTGVTEAEAQKRVREAVAAAKAGPVPTQAPAPDAGVLREVGALAHRIVMLTTGESGVPVAEIKHASRAALAQVNVPRTRQAVPAKPDLRHLGSAGITLPQQRILDTIAQLEAFGVDAPNKIVVAVHAGVSPKSSGYANNLGALRTKGLIDYPSGGRVALTDAGKAIANTPEKAPTLADLHASWLAMVTRPQAAILAPLIACYPGSVDRDQLAAFADVSAASSGYANNLGFLRTMGAIDYPERGKVRAAAILFPEKAR